MSKERYLNCKYLDAGMDGMLCSMDLCTTCKEFKGEKCSYYMPKNKSEEKEKQNKVNEYFANTLIKNCKMIVEQADKEIEEMEKTLYDYCLHYDDCVEGSERNLAKFLIAKGWVKLPEDSVVLTMQEWIKIQAKAQAYIFQEAQISQLQEELENKGKETAEKIANRLIEMFSTAMGVCSSCALQYDKAKKPTAREFQFGKYKGFEVAIKEVKELAKQLGIE